MKLLTAAGIHAWDNYTMKHEPVSEIDLMERAAGKAASFILTRFSRTRPVYVFCGKGNNGADGLVISRLLLGGGFQVVTSIVSYSPKASPLFTTSFSRLQENQGAEIRYFTEQADLPEIAAGALVIDAIFGTSVRFPLPPMVTRLISYFNQLTTARSTGHSTSEITTYAGNNNVETDSGRDNSPFIISIDMPSGLGADFGPPPADRPVQADLTLSFQVLKPSFLLPDTGLFCGEVVLLDINLSPSFPDTYEGNEYLTDLQTVKGIFRKRLTFSHKGTYGHALLIAGSRGKSGAAVLSAKGCLHAGAGLVSVFIPAASLDILQTSVPEAMAVLSPEAAWSVKFNENLDPYNAIGVGPGLGQHPETKMALLELLKTYQKPLVIDADALNMLAATPGWEELIPQDSILTPHIGEFDRLTGKSATSAERLSKQQHLAAVTKSVIVLKGAYTSVCLPTGRIWFNTTGNPGMATGGSGDTLTGILCALLAQGYPAGDASRLGVYIHGRAADLSVVDNGQTALSAGAISNYLGKAFSELENN